MNTKHTYRSPSLNVTGIFLSIMAMLTASLVYSQTITPTNALSSYIHQPDSTYRWEVVDSLKADDIMYYDLLLTSQTWRTITWKHQLTLLVPTKTQSRTALLYIAGGSINEQGLPRFNKNRDDRHLRAASAVAREQRVIVALLRQTPNQPLFGEKKEDELISMTLHQFQHSGDYTWPLLFPMVKSAVSAMDATQDFLLQKRYFPIDDYVVTGLSKRGWTTWLTAAIDDRVAAIAPMVIDVLRMPVSLQYQIDSWGTYSPEIQDYVALGIPQQTSSPKGRDIITMVDPYSYRKKLNMPKMLIMGTNDPYWVVDNVKNYLDSIPGQNQLHYVPNAGHDLGDGVQATQALSAFVGQVISSMEHPSYSWRLAHKTNNSVLHLETAGISPEKIILWEANAADKNFSLATWRPISSFTNEANMHKIKLSWPEEGYRAYYIDVVYRTPTANTYSQSTRMFLFGKNGLQ